MELEGFSFMGGRDLKIRNVPRVPGSPRIHVRGFRDHGRDRREEQTVPYRSGDRAVDHRPRPRNGERIARTAGRHGGDAGRRPHRPRGTGTRHQGAVPRPARRRADGRPERESSDGRTPPRRFRARFPVVGQRRPARGRLHRSNHGEGTVTILFSDMVDYAGMTERLGDQRSREVLRVAPPDRPPAARHVRWPRRYGSRVTGSWSPSEESAVRCAARPACSEPSRRTAGASGPSHPGPHRDPYR